MGLGARTPRAPLQEGEGRQAGVYSLITWPFIAIKACRMKGGDIPVFCRYYILEIPIGRDGRLRTLISDERHIKNYVVCILF